MHFMGIDFLTAQINGQFRYVSGNLDLEYRAACPLTTLKLRLGMASNNEYLKVFSQYEQMGPKAL